MDNKRKYCNVLFVILFICFIKDGLCLVCSGTKNGLSTRANARKDISVYMKEYANCTIIKNNVEVAFYSGPSTDTSFLDSIEEVKGYVLFVNNNFENITMKNLRIVRGNYDFEGSSIFIEGNYNLTKVLFPKLKEIVKGNVTFENNPGLCYVNKIDWKDIIYDNKNYATKIDDVATTCPDCEHCAFASCWSDAVCQEFRKKPCSERCNTGCLKDDQHSCCDKECVVGCTGRTDNCISCRHFNNSGKCVEQCPSLFVYNSLTEKKEPNPDGKYHFENECVDKCPGSTVQFRDSCVTNCPDNYYLNNGICNQCLKDSNCPKTCTMTTYFKEDNLKDFINCTIFEGHFQILSHLKADSIKPILDQFSSIEVITGFLVVQGLGEGIDDLSFFKSLKVIRGQRLAMSKNAALQIFKTKLKSLNIPHLERIENDRISINRNDQLEYLGLPSLKYIHGTADQIVSIGNNPKLCFVTDKTFNNISDPRKSIVWTLNKEENQCEEENKICHGECQGGCWGPGNKQCRFCRNFEFEGECLKTCDDYPNMFEEDGVCKKCDAQCKGGCHGEGPSNCKSCLNVKDSFICLDRCPDSKYVDPNTNDCKQCHRYCKDGCTGPLNVMGNGGCNNCHLLLAKSGECVDAGFKCDFGFIEYDNKYVYDTLGVAKYDVVKICSECHTQCKTCTGKGTSSLVCQCISVEYEGNCIQECPIQHYRDDQSKCISCDLECDNCFGPGPRNCSMCRNVAVYLTHNLNQTMNYEINVDGEDLDFGIDKNNSKNDFDIPKASHVHDDEFYCATFCPAHLPYENSIFKYDEITRREVNQRICDDEENQSEPSTIKSNTKLLIGMLIFGGLGFLVICAIVLGVLRAQKAKSEENKARLQAKIEGLNTEEILSPSTAIPDLASLRLIKENELDKGEEIGSGAFGTVYRGIWHPEGEKVRVAVAIKVLTEDSTSAQHKELLEEARVMASVSHPCCIRILAVCLTKEMMLITPLVAHGSLLTYLRKNGPNLSSSVLLKWATQMARGMGYLEHKGIVHRDLAARNILVQGLNQIKITDFGLAKLLNVDEEQFLATGGKLPMKWLALESIQHRIFTHKSDVWSYGITLWELFTYGQRPYENTPAVKIAEHLEMGERLPQPSICTIDVYMVMIKCWLIDSDDRPSFRELEDIFGEMSKDPGRYLVIMGDKMLRMPNDVFEDNRTGVIRVMNLVDDEDLICGEDYLCPATPRNNMFSEIQETSFDNQEYINEVPKIKGKELTYLEAALHSEKTKYVDRYNAEPGSNQPPRPPSLDEADIMKIEQNAKNIARTPQVHDYNNDEYLEAPQDNKYLDMKSPITDDRPTQMHQPSFGQRALLTNATRSPSDDKGVSIVSYNKINN